MISDKMAGALNHQINEELYSAYLYLAASSSLTAQGFTGGGKWMAMQAQEEVEHGMKIYKYLESQGVQPILEAIKEPPAEFKGLKKAFEAALKHEQHITGCIKKLVDQAKAENDYATDIFLQWFVTEQVEEEEHVGEVLQQLEMAGDAGGPLFMLDTQLGKREGD